MSSIRPETETAPHGTPCVYGATAYLAIYNAVKGQGGLIHGKIHDNKGAHCAIGSYFEAVGEGHALPSALVDEVATVNDSCRFLTAKQRRAAVMKWLRWKLKALGYGK